MTRPPRRRATQLHALPNGDGIERGHAIRARRALGSWAAAGRRDRGSAIAEFVMVAGLLLFVALAIFQVTLALYVRNTLVSAASEGARLAARADAAPPDGVTRTQSLIVSSLGEAYARQVSAHRRLNEGGVTVVEVSVRAPLPVVGPLGPSDALVVTARAFAEDQVARAAP